MINAVPLLAAAGGEYEISRSVRLRSSASAYFGRSLASTSNTQTWTWSGWVKRGALTSGGAFTLISASNGGASSGFWQQLTISSDQIDFIVFSGGVGSISGRKITNQVFRDPSAWYHIVAVFNTTSATGEDRMQLWVNGVRVTSWATNTIISQNFNGYINNNSYTHEQGALYYTPNTNFFDGYLTEINFIDGQALTPSSFGETDSITGVWKPKKYAGTYGTNGFYLNFSDNSNNTAATIGKDYSGNGNNWTPNNISVTSGATYDSMLDVPTNWADGGNGRGNYAVLNPLQKGSVITVSAANLQFASSSGNSYCPSTIGATTGKWYCEVFMTSAGTAAIVGIVNENATTASYPGGNTNGYGYFRDGQKYTNGAGSAYGNSYTDNDIIGIALDLDSGKVWFSKNGTWQASGDPAAGTNAAFTGISATNTWFFACGNSGVTTQNANFGQRPFAYTPPSGFKALNTQNLPEPTIKKGNQYMDVAIQTGNTTGRTVSGLAFQPDLVWVKNRAGSTNRRWGLIDSVRGVNKTLTTQATDAEVTSQTDLLTAFNSDGFTIGADAGLYGWNGFAESYAHFVWKESAVAGFDIVTYTGNGGTGASSQAISHSLGVSPSMAIIKSRSAASTNWMVEHIGLTAGGYALVLNGTGAQSGPFPNDYRFAQRTSSTYQVGSTGGSTRTNANGETYVAYLFAEVAGFSKFGSYTGNGSSDGPFVFCGFRPRFIMTKRTDSTSDWIILDTSRNTYNVAGSALFPNSASSETTNGWYDRDFLSNGFKIRASVTEVNASGGTYIYAAFAENPFKYSLAR